MTAFRVKTGIPGLDDLIGGGLIPGSAVLVAGPTGAGKTLFCLQFLWHGLLKGEPGVYVTFEQSPEEVKEDASMFGWNFDAYERKKMCRIVFYDPLEIADTNKLVVDEVKRIGAKRLVIDSTSVFAMYVKDEFKMREKIYKLVQSLKKTGCTVLMTSEVIEHAKGFSRYAVEEFVADGVIGLYYTGIGGEEFNNIEIRKMRRTKHARGYFPLEFTNDGLRVVT